MRSSSTGPHTLTFRDGQIQFVFYPDVENVAMVTPFKASFYSFDELEKLLVADLARRLSPGSRQVEELCHSASK